jgi:predicted permease
VIQAAALTATDAGFGTESRLAFNVSVVDMGYRTQQTKELFDQIEARVAALPGVRSVGLTSGLPATVSGSSTRVNLLDKPLDEGLQATVRYRVTSPSYLSTMGVALLRGRNLALQDGRPESPGVVVNRTMADRFFPGEDPSGRKISLGNEGSVLGASSIVGVVENVRMDGIDRTPPPVVYLSRDLKPERPLFTLALQAEVPPEGLVGSVREVVGGLDPHLPIYSLLTLEEVVTNSVASRRNSKALPGSLAILALVMAVVGVYGVLSFLVSRRDRELRTRMARGADRSRILALVMRQCAFPVAMGILLGVAGALGFSRFMSSLLFGVSPTDPRALFGGTLLLTLAAVLAMYVPARRATKLDPARTLRLE